MKKRVYLCLATATVATVLAACVTAEPHQTEPSPEPTVEADIRPEMPAPTAPTPVIGEAVAIEPEPSYTEEELKLLALVIYQEAGGDACSDECRQMVGEVALNRVADDRFPDSLEEVLLQPWQYGSLCKTGLVWPARASKDVEAHAVQRAYDAAEALLSGAVERLLPEDVVFQSEHVQGTEIVAEVDGFYFCR